MRGILLLFIFLLSCSLTVNLQAQSCFGNFAGPPVNLSCTQNCVPFSARIPEIRSTEDYTVVSIPYNPYPFVTAAPALSLACGNQDDKFFAASHIPFSFCFYGQTYTDLVVGTNGLITFDLSNSLNCNQWDLRGSSGAKPIPFTGTGGQCGGSCPTPSGVLYPRAAIMGAYQDIDIDNASPNKKMEFRIEGTRPCRRAVISFNEIPNFQCAVTSTTEIVIYESTGIVEIYVRDKPSGCSWNDDAAILGIQNWNRDAGLAPPGRNLGSWGSVGMNEAWQFQPNGAFSLLDHVELLLNNVLVATGTLGSLSNGFYNVDFGNVCPPTGNNNYVVRGYYKTCNDNSRLYTLEDTVQINKLSSFFTNGMPTYPLCFGLSTGQVVFNPFGGVSPYLYSNDGGVTYQNSNIFSGLPAGSYTFRVKDNTNCTNDTTIVITQPTAVINTLTKTDVTCNGGSTGTVTSTYGGGTPPYQINIDGGAFSAATGSPQTFNGLGTGNHTVCVKDSNNCQQCTSIVVNQSPPVTNTLTKTDVLCNGGTTGTITVTYGGGVPPYFIKIDGGAYNPATGSPQTINGINAGSHTICVKDNNNCELCASITVNEPAAVINTLTKTDVLCNGGSSGTITSTYGGGAIPYMIKIDGGAYAPATGSPQVFNGLAAGSHTVCVKDNNGCETCTTITVNEPAAVTNTLTETDVLCNGGNTGTITVTYGGGVQPYFINVDGGAYNAATGSPQIINGINAGNHTVCVKDINGCLLCTSITVSEPVALTGSAVTTNATCYGKDGMISITTVGGVPAYQYSVDNGITWQNNNVFNGLPGGNYTVIARDVNGCRTNIPATIILIDTMRLELGPDSTICFGSSLTLMPQTNDSTNIFKWTPAAGLNADSVKNPVATPNDTTHYILTARWGSCQRKDTITINVKHKPIPFAGRDTSICYKSFALLTGSARNLSGTVNYAWTPSATVLPPNSPIAVARPDTTQLYILTVTDNYGCNFTVSDSILVTMDPPVPAFAGNDTIAITGKPHQLMASGGVSYLWSPATNLDNPFIQNPLATLYNDTYFRVIVTDVIGCKGSDDVFVKVYNGPTYYVPNAFSPNGDGLNDIFRPIPSGIKRTDYFIVYNRYGEIVFQTSKWLEGWDGRYRGKEALAGTYVWIIKGTDINGKVVEMKGTVTLVR